MLFLNLSWPLNDCQLMCVHYIINVPFPGNIKAQVRCDDEGAVFLDGKFAGSTSYFTEIWKSSLARNTMVMAVKCKNNYGPGGLLASFSNGIVSNRHWKCGNSEISCTDIDFDDSVWKDAREIMSIQYDLEKKSAFPPEAKWIWVDGDNHHVEFQEICCRVLLRELNCLLRVEG